MPEPTREQFEAAAQKVIEMGRPGMSEDEFLDAVDQHLRMSAPVEQPNAEGFLTNALDDGIDMVSSIPGVVKTILTQRPDKTLFGLADGIAGRVKQIAGDMHPIDAAKSAAQGKPMQALGQLLPVGEAYKQPVTMAADVYGGATLAKAARKITQVPRIMRERDLAKRTGPHVPNKSGYKPGPVPTAPGEADPAFRQVAPFSDPYMPNKSGYDGPVDGDGGSSQVPYRPNTEDMTPDVAMNRSFNIHDPAPDGYVRPDGPWDNNGAPAASAGPGPASIDDAVYESIMERLGGGGKATAHPAQPPGMAGQTAPGPRPNFKERRRQDSAAMAGGKRASDPAAEPTVNANPKADYTQSLRDGGPDHPLSQRDWHAWPDDESRAAASPEDRALASRLHKSDAELEARYRHLLDDESGSVMAGLPANLVSMLTRYLVREAASQAFPTIGGPVRRAATGAKNITKGAAKTANVGRMGEKRDNSRP